MDRTLEELIAENKGSQSSQGGGKAKRGRKVRGAGGAPYKATAGGDGGAQTEGMRMCLEEEGLARWKYEMRNAKCLGGNAGHEALKLF